MKKVLLLLVSVLCIGTVAQATTATHYWNFEGADDTERLQDKVGDLDLSHHNDTLANKADLSAGTLNVSEAGYGVIAADFTQGEDLNFGTGSYSYSFDIKCTSTTDDRQFRVMQANTATMGINCFGGTTQSSCATIGGSNIKTAVNFDMYDEDTGVFTHVVVNVDRSGETATTTVYFDGVDVTWDPPNADTLTADYPVYATRFQIGYRDNGGTAARAQPGELDNLAFYDGILNDNQINGLANGTLTPLTVHTITAHNPYPSDGQTEVSQEVTLTWTAAMDPNNVSQVNPAVKKHYLYGNFNNDPADPNLYLLDTIDVGTESYGPLSLDPITAYQWYVEEAVDNGAGGVYPPGDPNNLFSPVWTFTTLDLAPSITTQPVGVTVAEGEQAVFTIEGGSSIVSYEWYKVGDATLLSDTDTLTIDTAQLADEGQYYCVVYNANRVPLESDHVGLWTKRLMAHWTFDDTMENEVDDIHAGVYSDPNEANPVAPVPVYAAGKVGSALQLADDGLHVRVADSNDFFNFYPQGYTAAGWVYCDVLSDIQCIAGKNDYLNQEGWVYRVSGTYLQSILRTGSGYYQLTGLDAVLEGGTWYYVVASYAAGERIAVYVNGRLAGSYEDDGSISVPTSTVPLILGAGDADGNNPLVGLLDEVKLWSYPLSDEDVLQEYVNVTGVTECFANPTFDVSGPSGEPDCVVNLYDFAEFASTWLDDGFVNPVE